MAGVTGQRDGVSTTNTPASSVSIESPAVAVRPSIRPRVPEPAHADDDYTRARGDPTKLPWWEGGPCPALVSWLNAVAPQVIRPGARTAVSCCGLGDDAVLLADRGYDVTAFDAAPAAIDWAQRRHPRAATYFEQANLFDPRRSWRGRFDFVVDVNALCHASDRAGHLRGLRSLMTNRALLLVICHGAGDATAAPGPLDLKTLASAAREAALAPVGEIGDFEDQDAAGRGHRRLRALFERSSAA